MIKDQQRGLAWLVCLGIWVTLLSPLHESLEDLGGIVFAVLVATASGFLLWLGTPMLLLGERDWRFLAPGALVSGLLGALLGVASSIYIPIAMDWSAREVRPDRDRLRAPVVAARGRLRDRDRRGDRRDRRRARRGLQGRAWLTPATSTSRAARGWPPSAPGWPGGARASPPSTAAVAVGGVVPQLIDGSRTPYVVLGCGYALLAAAMFVAAGLRRLSVTRALERGEYQEVGEGVVWGLSRRRARARARHARDHHHPAVAGSAEREGSRNAGGEADERQDPDHRPSRARTSVAGGEAGDQDRAGDGGAERGAEVRDAARQARRSRPAAPRGSRLDDVDRRGEHHAEAQPDQEQPGRERPCAGDALDQGEQDDDPDDRGDEARQRSASAAGAAWRSARRPATTTRMPSVAAVKITPVWMAS